MESKGRRDSERLVESVVVSVGVGNGREGELESSKQALQPRRSRRGPSRALHLRCSAARGDRLT